MSGTTCAKTFSAPGSGTPTTTSSRPAQPHGAFSSATLNASDQSAIATGRVSVFKRVGITRDYVPPALVVEGPPVTQADAEGCSQIEGREGSGLGIIEHRAIS